MSDTRSILIVEDDLALREILVEQLTENGDFAAFEAVGVDQATRLLASHEIQIDAIILDISLPDGDGFEFCLRLRRQGCKIPIIMLTGASSDADVVRGLNAGANDYVAKPFRANELLARLRAQLRIFDNSVDAVFSLGPYTFRPGSKLLIRLDDNQRIRLTGKEVAILKFLHKTSERVVSRQTLLDRVWGYKSDVTTHTLETHIYRLRQKIEVDPTNCRLLMTVPGGYHLVKATDPQFVPDTASASAGLYHQPSA